MLGELWTHDKAAPCVNLDARGGSMVEEFEGVSFGKRVPTATTSMPHLCSAALIKKGGEKSEVY